MGPCSGTQSELQASLDALGTSPSTPGAASAGAASAATPGAASAGTPQSTPPPRAVGRPAWKTEAGKVALGLARQSETERHDHGAGPANELLAKSLEEEGEPCTSPYAQQQAKSAAKGIFAAAGSLGSAEKVVERLNQLPEVTRRRALCARWTARAPHRARCAPAAQAAHPCC